MLFICLQAGRRCECWPCPPWSVLSSSPLLAKMSPNMEVRKGLYMCIYLDIEENIGGVPHSF